MTGPQRTSQTLALTLVFAFLTGFSLAARAQGAPPPAGDAPAPTVGPQQELPPGYGPPPTAQAYPPPQPAYPPPGYAPGYPPGYAPGYPPPGYVPVPEVQPHSGIYVHLHLGGGFTSLSETSYGQTVKVSGGDLSLNVAVGFSVIPNLAVFGNLIIVAMANPTVSVNGVSGSGTTNDSASLAGFGAGVVYYFQPVNLYVSGAVAAIGFDFSDSSGNTTEESEIGIGFQGMVGKEWLVSPRWGLGVAGEFIAASMKDKTDPSARWGAGTFSVVFSATYN